MKRVWGISLLLAVLIAVLVSSGIFAAGAAPATASSHEGSDNGKYQHIFYIMMENHGTKQIIGNTADAPYINQLASKYAVAMNYYGVTHPSLPEYLAAISGNFQGIWDDCAAGQTVKCAPQEFGPGSSEGNLLTPAEFQSASNTAHWFSGKTIVDQLEQNGLSWKAYMQSMPTVGYTGEYYPYIQQNGQTVPVKLYAQKHNPFMYFSNIRNNPARMQKVVPFTQFDQDLNSGNVPNFTWISPDQCHDMHGVSPASAAYLNLPACGYPASGLDHGAIQLGDAYLKDTVGKIMHSKAWGQHSAIVLAWDENDYSGYTGCCHSPTGVNGVTLGGGNAPLIVINSDNAHHFVDTTTSYNEYNILAAIERVWHLGCLEKACDFHGKQLMGKYFGD